MAKFLTRIRRAIHNAIFYPPQFERVIRDARAPRADARVRRDADPLADYTTVTHAELRAYINRVEPADADTPVTYTIKARGGFPFSLN